MTGPQQLARSNDEDGSYPAARRPDDAYDDDTNFDSDTSVFVVVGRLSMLGGMRPIGRNTECACVDIQTRGGEVIRLARFVMVPEVTPGITEGAEGRFIFTRCGIETRLVATHIGDARRAIAELSNGFKAYYVVQMILPVISIGSIIGLVAFPIVGPIAAFNIVRLALSRQKLRRVLRSEGFAFGRGG